MGKEKNCAFEFPLLSKEYIVEEISKIDSVSVEKSDENGLLVWDDVDAKEIPFHFLEEMSPEILANMIFLSQDIPSKFQINKGVFAEYLWNTCDKNAFVTLDEFVVIWSEPDDPATNEPSDFVDSESNVCWTSMVTNMPMKLVPIF